MIAKSIAYKLVRKSDMIVIAEGNKKEMDSLRKKTPDTQIWLSSCESKLGQKIN